MDELIVANILANRDGGTYSLVGQPLPSKGFWVGNGRCGFTLPVQSATRPLLLDMIQYVRSIAGATHVGWWTDNGRLYVEPTEWYTSPCEAEKVARKRGELAFFDIAAGRDVRLDVAA